LLSRHFAKVVTFKFESRRTGRCGVTQVVVHLAQRLTHATFFSHLEGTYKCIGREKLGFHSVIGWIDPFDAGRVSKECQHLYASLMSFEEADEDVSVITSSSL